MKRFEETYNNSKEFLQLIFQKLYFSNGSNSLLNLKNLKFKKIYLTIQFFMYSYQKF